MFYTDDSSDHPLNNPAFHSAIAQDYLELMGEIADSITDISSHILLVEYGTERPDNKDIIPDSVR